MRITVWKKEEEKNTGKIICTSRSNVVNVFFPLPVLTSEIQKILFSNPMREREIRKKLSPSFFAIIYNPFPIDR